MVTVRRFGKVRLRVMSGDHIPPHAHIDTPEGELSLDLGTGESLGSRSAKRSGKQALEWAKANLEDLRSVWEELNK
jgi:hypothetical protein